MFLYLASSSPRRQELLRQLGLRFEVVAPAVDEAVQANEAPRDYVLRLARAKAAAGQGLVAARACAPILGADTAVVLDGEILGKPRDRTDGIALLQRLASRTHEVLTGLCLIHEHGVETALSCTRVRFGPLSAEDCANYWDSGEAADKAGGYGIQGRAAAFVAEIHGSYSGVVGLPLYELAQLLKMIGRSNE